MSKIVEADIVVSRYPYAPVNVANYKTYTGTLNFATPESADYNPFFGSASMTAIPYTAKVIDDMVYLRIETTESFEILYNDQPIISAVGLDLGIPPGAAVFSVLQGLLSVPCMALIRGNGVLQLVANKLITAVDGTIAFPPVTINYFKCGPGYFA